MGKRKLGRGLQALLGGGHDDDEPSFEAVLAESGHSAEVHQLPLIDLEPNPFQPRRHFDPAELAQLSQSIHLHGLIQPILVRPQGNRYQIVAGERRFRAAQEAGLSQVPVRVLELNDQQTFEFALVENLQRRDLNALEKAQAFQDYIGRFAVTHEELAGHLGVDRSTVTNLIRLLELPQPIQQMVRAEQITFGHARALLGVGDPAEMVALAKRVQLEGLNVRQVEALVREPRPSAAAAQPKAPGRAALPKTTHILSLESELKRRFGSKVEIRPKSNDKGTILIHFASNDEFDRLMQFLNGAA